MGHPVLRRRADVVADPAAAEIRQLVADMIETMADADGAGLAAPQVHVSKRVVIFHAAEDRLGAAEESAPEPLTVLINPEIEPIGDEIELGREACLSVPGLTGIVPRHLHIRYRGLTPAGETIERAASGFHARVVQHECDHLDGVLYPMRMTDLSTLGFVEEAYREARDAAEEAAGEEAEDREAEDRDAEDEEAFEARLP